MYNLDIEDYIGTLKWQFEAGNYKQISHQTTYGLEAYLKTAINAYILDKRIDNKTERLIKESHEISFKHTRAEFPNRQPKQDFDDYDFSRFVARYFYYLRDALQGAVTRQQPIITIKPRM